MKRRCFAGYFEYLKERGGRYLKDGRPDPWSKRNTRITYEEGGPNRSAPYHIPHIAIVLYRLPVVKLWANGDVLITASGWQTNTTAQCIRDHSNAQVWRHRGEYFISINNCTYWFSQPHDAYNQFAPWPPTVSGRDVDGKPLRDARDRRWGHGQAMIPAAKGRLIRDMNGHPLLSVAKQKEFDEEFKRREREKGKRRSRWLRRFNYYLGQLWEGKSEAERWDLMRQWGMESTRRADMLSYQLEDLKRRMTKMDEANYLLVDDNKQYLQKLKTYQRRLASWSLLAIEQPPEEDRQRVILVDEEINDGRVRETITGPA